MEPPPLPRLMLPHRLALPLAPRGEVTREALWENQGFGYHMGEDTVLVPLPSAALPGQALCSALSSPACPIAAYLLRLPPQV